jgi:peptidoglycan/xylan/chitin deacetylase (PgdA/CDA1 family)
VPNQATRTLADIVQRGLPGRRRVALTFDSNMTVAMLHKLDDGKVASYANTAVIDQLDALGVPATFFLAGLWMERYPDVTAHLAADPRYELGTHSYAHKGFTASCYGLGTIAAADMAADVDHAVQVLRHYTDHPVPYFRFPGLCVDQTALDAIAPMGLTVVHGDVPSGDAFGTDPQAIVRQTLRGVHDGSIVILHITGGDTAPRTQDAIGPIVQGLRDAGYDLVKVSDLLRG